MIQRTRSDSPLVPSARYCPPSTSTSWNNTKILYFSPLLVSRSLHINSNHSTFFLSTTIVLYSTRPRDNSHSLQENGHVNFNTSLPCRVCNFLKFMRPGQTLPTNSLPHIRPGLPRQKPLLTIISHPCGERNRLWMATIDALFTR